MGWIYMKYTIRIAIDEKLEELGKTRYWLSKQAGIAYQTIDNYYKNKVTRYEAETILKICLALDCQAGDIIKIVKN